MVNLSDKKVVIIVGVNGFRDKELFDTKKVLEEAGIKTVITSNRGGVAKPSSAEGYGVAKPASVGDYGVAMPSSAESYGVAMGVDGGEIGIDMLIEEVNPEDFDAVVFIGGPGALENLDNENSYRLVKETMSQEKILSAICIAPVIVAKAGALKGKSATVWSSSSDKTPIEILESNGAKYINEPVVQDGKIITADGPSASTKFGQAIIEAIKL